MALGDTIKAYRTRDALQALADDKSISYWKDSAGNWFIHFPNQGISQLTPTVTVTEHEDRTISLSANISVTQQKPSNGTTTTSRFGKFVRGGWRE